LEFTYQGRTLTVMPIDFMIVCNTNGVQSTTAENCTNWVNEANLIFDQIALKTYVRNISYVANSDWFRLNYRDNLTINSLLSSLPSANGFKVFVVNEIDGVPGVNIGGFNVKKKGTVICGNSQLNRLAHELVHQCGPRDIYAERPGDCPATVPLPNGDVKREWLPNDWTSADPHSHYQIGLTQPVLIRKLIMCGIYNPTRRVISSGDVYGIKIDYPNNVKTYSLGPAEIGRQRVSIPIPCHH